MTPHKPRKPAPVEYTTDEEDMIVYDIEEEVETTKSIIKGLSDEFWFGAAWPKLALAPLNPTFTSLHYRKNFGKMRVGKRESNPC
ncbi:hypothetical protein TNCV_5119861 [Trichonephila clavipes]|nr:hypothetical protein TNCV_5119861 [Trichonephila clavipes]